MKTLSNHELFQLQLDLVRYKMDVKYPVCTNTAYYHTMSKFNDVDLVKIFNQFRQIQIEKDGV